MDISRKARNFKVFVLSLFLTFFVLVLIDATGEDITDAQGNPLVGGEGYTEEIEVTVTVEFTDENLEARVRKEIDVPEGDIKELDLVALTSLNASMSNIEVLEGLEFCGNLEQLNIHSNDLTDIEALSGLTNLKTLDIRFNPITDASLKYLKGLGNLQNLALTTTDITDAGVKHLKGLDNLRELNLSYTNVTDAGVKYLGELRNLQVLNLRATDITDAGLEYLNNLDNLRELNLSYTDVTGNGFKYLRTLNNLHELRLRRTNITYEGLEHLSDLVNLRYLSLRDTDITDEGLKHLKDLDNLRELHLCYTGLTGEGLEYLMGLDNLEKLCLRDTEVVDKELEHLEELDNLQRLSLWRTDITDKGLVHLKKLDNLQRLSLWNTEITDAGLKHLKGLGNLQELDLRYTNITGTGLRHLNGLESLQELDLRYICLSRKESDSLRDVDKDINIKYNCVTEADVSILTKGKWETGERQFKAETISVSYRAELSPAQRARMTGRSVYHDRDEEVVVVVDEKGEIVKRVKAEDARVIVNRYTEDFLVAHTPGVGEKTTVKVFDRRGDLKLDIEVDIRPGFRERIVGTLDNAVITRPFAFGPVGTKYTIYRYDQEGKQTLTQHPGNILVDACINGNTIWTRRGFGASCLTRYDSRGAVQYEYSFPENQANYRHFVSRDGRHLLTCYRPEDERHRHNYTLHIEGRGPVEWEGRRAFGRRPHHPVLFRDDEEMLFYRDTQGIKAYDYDGNRIWTAHLPNRHSTYSLAIHKIGDRSVLSSYEVKDGVPRIAHYSLPNGFRLGITDLSEYIDMDEYGDELDRVPGRFYADAEGNVSIPISDAYVIVRFDSREQ